MNLKLWLPFLLAPVIGIGLGWHLFRATHPDPAVSAVSAPRAAAPSGRVLLSELANVFDRTSPPVAEAPDTEAAFIAALAEAPGPQRIKTLQAAYIRWVLQHPVSALAAIDRIPADERQEVVAHALALLAQQRPEHFLTYANGITDNYTTYMAAAMGVLAESNPRLALTLVQRNQERGDPHGAVIGAILPSLIRDDLAFAAETVAAMKDRASIAHIQQVATAYARHDPQQAYDWVQQVLAGRTDLAPGQILNDITGSFVASHPAEAVQYLNRARDSQVKKSLLNELAIHKGQDDLAAAWAWLNQYRDSEHYGETALNLLYRWSYTRPEEVAKILPTITDASLQAMAATHLSRFWQKKDPAGHQAWLASLPPGTLKNSAHELH